MSTGGDGPDDDHLQSSPSSILDRQPNPIGSSTDGKNPIPTTTTTAILTTSNNKSHTRNQSSSTSIQLNNQEKSYSLSVQELNSFIDPKSIKSLYQLGGPERIASKLGTDLTKGLSTSDSESIQKISTKYGPNQIPQKPTRSIWTLIFLAIQDKVLIILIIAAFISLALGIYTTVGTPPKTFQDSNGNTIEEPKLDWVEGCAILVAVIIVTLVGSINDYQKEQQFRKLNTQKEDRSIKVLRNGGQEVVVSIHDLVVGDIVLIDAGDVLPTDGIFLKGGFEVECDESTVTGESDLIKKIDYEQALLRALEIQRSTQTASGGQEAHGDVLEVDVHLGKSDCFMISGSRVVQGYGKYLVTSVGQNSFFGKMMISLRTETENTPLQLKLNSLAELIAKLGATAGLVLFTALMIRFFVQLKTDPDRSPNDKAQSFIQVLIISVTVVVVAVPEGLPLAVTLALAFATRRMTKMNLLVRVLSSCETMANATVICTDKTGTLTQNRMKIVAGSIGVHLKFAKSENNRPQIDSSGQSPSPKDSDGPREADLKSLEEGRTSKDIERVNPHINVIQPDEEEETQLSGSDDSNRMDFSVDQESLSQTLSKALIDILNQSICLNSTAFEAYVDNPIHNKKASSSGHKKEFIGSKTETALLSFNQDQGWADYKVIRQSFEIVQMIPFSSARKCMGVVIKLPHSDHYRLYLKGASEILSQLSSHYVICLPDQEGEQESQGEEVRVAKFDAKTRDNINRTIIFYANQSLRTIALCYRDFDSWPPSKTAAAEERVNKEATSRGDDDFRPSREGGSTSEHVEIDFDDLVRKGEEGLTLVALVGIEDPLRDGVAQAVADCSKAGVAVKMITGDNILTAKSIASQCGIYTPGGIIMEGPIFRQLTKKELLEIIPRLQVLARSSPEDKKKLVEHLKMIGEVCGVTGDGTNDGPALKTANVGFSMGLSGTEVAKEASDIILMDDNFSSIVDAIMWGRCVNDSVKKFLQFQLSVNITAVIITFVTSVASSTESSILTAVQLLWVNLIMDTFAALALATDPASRKSLERKPDHKLANLITVQMWLMILGQSMYQLIVILILNFQGRAILNLGPSVDDSEIVQLRKEDELKTIVFNSFVFCQIWNLFNSRVLDRSLNVFRGIFANAYFMVIFMIMLGGQILIVEVGGAAFQVTRIGVRDWAISVIIGLLSLPIGVFIKLLPTELIEKKVYQLGWMDDPEGLKVEMVEVDETDSDDGDSNKWNPAIDKVRDNLATFSQIRGGRMRSSSFVKRSRTYMMKEKGIHTGALMTMVPTLVMTSIGAGWQPKKSGGSLADPASSRPNRSSTKLWSERVEVHPDTDPSDPVVIKFGGGRFEDRAKLAVSKVDQEHSQEADQSKGFNMSSSSSVKGELEGSGSRLETKD